jgi:hypothetical protein
MIKIKMALRLSLKSQALRPIGINMLKVLRVGRGHWSECKLELPVWNVLYMFSTSDRWNI